MTPAWNIRSDLDRRGLQHDDLSDYEALALASAVRGWTFKLRTPAGARPIIARVWLAAALAARGAYRAPERDGHLADLQDGEPLVDSMLLMALVQRHFMADTWELDAVAAALGVELDEVERAQALVETLAVLVRRPACHKLTPRP